MSKLLRYDAARRGLFVDTEGFVPLRSVALALGRSIDDIIACTETSFIRCQPRFEVRLDNNQSMFVRALRKNHLVQYSQSDGGDGIVGPCRDPRNPSYLGYWECVARGLETPAESTPLPRGSTLGSPIPNTGAVPVTRNGEVVFVRRAADGFLTHSQPARSQQNQTKQWEEWKSSEWQDWKSSTWQGWQDWSQLDLRSSDQAKFSGGTDVADDLVPVGFISPCWPSCNIKPADDLSEDDAAVRQKVDDFVRSLPKGDSFSSEISLEINVVRETHVKTGNCRAALRLPPHSPVLRQAPWSDWFSSGQTAECQAYRRALQELMRKGGPLHSEPAVAEKAVEDNAEHIEPSATSLHSTDVDACIYGVVENIMDGSAKVNIGSGVILTVSLPDEVQRKLKVNDILDHVRVVRRNRYNVLSLDWPTARVEEAF